MKSDKEETIYRRSLFGLALLVATGSSAMAHSDPLPSWNDGAAKHAILDFIARTTTTGSGELVPVPERIAVFDKDGTLWSEQPVYFQLAFALDRVKALAVQHPEWKERFDSFIDRNAGGRKGQGTKR